MHVFFFPSTYLDQEAAISSGCSFWENKFSLLSRNRMGSKKALLLSRQKTFSPTIYWESFRWDFFLQVWVNCFLLWWSSALFQRNQSWRWPLLIFLSSSFYEHLNLHSQMLCRVNFLLFCFSSLINNISKTWISKNVYKKIPHTNL